LTDGFYCFLSVLCIRKSASKLDLYTEIYDETRLICNLYDKWNDFKFPIVSFPFLCSNITGEQQSHKSLIKSSLAYPFFCIWLLQSINTKWSNAGLQVLSLWSDRVFHDVGHRVFFIENFIMAKIVQPSDNIKLIFILFYQRTCMTKVPYGLVW
jgi:hypothetical protein